jgi:phytanoyl-CoA hydroxylase
MEESRLNILFDEFDVNGYFILRDFFHTEVLEEVKREIGKIVDLYAERVNEINKNTNEPFETRLYRLFKDNLQEAPSLFRTELHMEEFFSIFFNNQLLDIVEKILGDEILLYPNYSVRPKLPDFEAARVLWHQDAGYTAMGNNTDHTGNLRMVNVWTPLVQATVVNGCMQFVPGSHKMGVVPHVKKQYYLEIASEYLEPTLKDAVNIELNPGDVVLFHNLLFHQGLPNKSDHIRWSLDWRYLDATQPTLRQEKGHLARSKSRSELVVSSKEKWAVLSFS